MTKSKDEPHTAGWLEKISTRDLLLFGVALLLVCVGVVATVSLFSGGNNVEGAGLGVLSASAGSGLIRKVLQRRGEAIESIRAEVEAAKAEPTSSDRLDEKFASIDKTVELMPVEELLARANGTPTGGGDSEPS